MQMTKPSGGRLNELNQRFKVRLERLQRLLDAAGGLEPADAEAASRPIVSIPADKPEPLSGTPLIGESDKARITYVGEHDPRRRLLPYPGYANATAAEQVSACIGLNLIGAPRPVWRNLVGGLQSTLDRRRGHTFVCVTDDSDIGYFIKRGITFEFIGYTDRLDDPAWRAYFELNMDLIAKKYGITQFITVAPPRTTGG
jgi:hypothetical protein